MRMYCNERTGVVAMHSSRWIFLTQGWNPCLLYLPRWQAGSLPLVPLGCRQWAHTEAEGLVEVNSSAILDPLGWSKSLFGIFPYKKNWTNLLANPIFGSNQIMSCLLRGVEKESVTTYWLNNNNSYVILLNAVPCPFPSCSRTNITEKLRIPKGMQTETD